MTIRLTTPVTGGAQSGFSTPGYVLTADQAPNASTGVQYSVSSLTGTQAGVRPHSITDPFTITSERPGVLKTLAGLVSGVTGLYGKVPENVYKVFHVRKGVNIAANNIPRIMEIRCEARIPAGADAYDSANVKAAVSLLVGAFNQQSSGIGDTLLTGTV